MSKFHFVAPCLFGLEGILAGELRRMGAENVQADNGKVEFSGDEWMLARANIGLRTAERVLIQLGSFPAHSFEDLFQGVKSLPWEDFIGKKDAFPVKGWSLNSVLHSVPDCQAIIKKAVVERMKSHYHQEWFTETGPVHQIQFSILKDQVSVMLDTSGAGLHKRGYRQKSNDAPLKETLAAGIVDLARVKGYSHVCDPFCGSGTFLIEAATKAMNIPPCIRRKFSAQEWGLFPEKVWQEERARGIDLIRKDAQFVGWGSDIDPAAVELAKKNARKAGVLSKLSVTVKDIRQFRAEENLITLSNPPYGERMLEKKDAEGIYRIMGKVFAPMPGSSYLIITPHEQFEQIYGKRANKRRKLYNGMIKCQVYLYF